MSVMKGAVLCFHLLLVQQAVFQVTAQTVTIQLEGTLVANSAATLSCTFTEAWNTGALRRWIGPGSSTLINDGVSTDPAKYSETIDSANNKFLMTIQNYNSSDDGPYQCLYRFTTSGNVATLSISTAEFHPASTSQWYSLTIPDAGQRIDLNFPVSEIKPAATASFNLTSSSGTLKPAGTGNAAVTTTASGQTFTSTITIDVPAGTTTTGDVFTIELVIGSFSDTRQWTITATPVKLMLIYALGGGGIFAAVLCIIIVWTVYCHFCAKKEYCSCCAVFKCCFPPDSSEDEEKKKGCKKCTEKQSWIASLVLTVVCVLGLLLCIIGMGIASSSEGAGLGLVVFGLVIAVVTLFIVVILVTMVRRQKIIIVIAKDTKPERSGPDGQEGKLPPIDSKPGAQTSPRSPTSASNIRPKWKHNQVSDSNESDGSNVTPRRKLEDVPPGRQLPPRVVMDSEVDASQRANKLEPITQTETKKLKKKKKNKRQKQEEAQDW